MKNSLHIAIPQPCQENWDKMIPTEQGAFCDVCSKCVVDFTQFSDADLLAYFSNAPKNVCGRFEKKQLIPPAAHTPIIPSFAKRLFLGLAMVAGLGTTLNAQTSTISNQPTTQQQPNHSNNSKQLSPQTTSDTTGIISGVVLDNATNEPLFGVAIQVKDISITTYTDFDGCFEFKLPKEYLNQPFTIEVRYIGYAAQLHTGLYYAGAKTRFSKIYMSENTMSFTVGFLIYHKPTRWQRFKAFFKNLF